MSILLEHNGCDVLAYFNFYKGTPASFDDPGCDDEVEIQAVWWTTKDGEQVDIYPILSESDLENLHDQIYAKRGDYEQDY